MARWEPGLEAESQGKSKWPKKEVCLGAGSQPESWKKWRCTTLVYEADVDFKQKTGIILTLKKHLEQTH